jgi:hypothetical protein
MRRSVLLTISAMGLLVCLLGSTGLFAALTDVARTGTNTATSDGLAPSADLQLATGVFVEGFGISCGTFQDNLATPLTVATGLKPGDGGASIFCIRNVGSQSVTLAATVDELTDVDISCTGDEADYGDTTCGGDLLGELSSVLTVTYVETPCAADPPVPTPVGNSGLAANAATPIALGSLGPNQLRCLSVAIDYHTGQPAAAVQKAQSDRVTWRYVFTGQA